MGKLQIPIPSETEFEYFGQSCRSLTEGIFLSTSVSFVLVFASEELYKVLNQESLLILYIY